MSLIDLHPILFPVDTSYGMEGNFQFNNTFDTSVTGKECVAAGWSGAKKTFSFKHDLLDYTEFEAFKTFYLCRFGESYRFLFKDWMDYTFGVGATGLKHWFTVSEDGYKTPTQLVKKYIDTVSTYQYERNITRAVISTLKFWRSDIGFIDASDYTIQCFKDDASLVKLTPACPPSSSIDLHLWRNGNWGSSMPRVVTASNNPPVIVDPWTNPSFISHCSVQGSVLNLESNISSNDVNKIYVTFNVVDIAIGSNISINLIYNHTVPDDTYPGQYRQDKSDTRMDASIVVGTERFYYKVLSTYTVEDTQYSTVQYALELSIDDYWDGDSFCFYIKHYTSTGVIVWEEYSDWFQFFWSSDVGSPYDITHDGIVTWADDYSFVKDVDVYVSGEFLLPVRFLEDQSVGYETYHGISWNGVKITESGI